MLVCYLYKRGDLFGIDEKFGEQQRIVTKAADVQ
jgi:hypothetical protein